MGYLNLDKKIVKVCWRCGKEWSYKKDYKSKIMKKGKRFNDTPST